MQNALTSRIGKQMAQIEQLKPTDLFKEMITSQALSPKEMDSVVFELQNAHRRLQESARFKFSIFKN